MITFNIQQYADPTGQYGSLGATLNTLLANVAADLNSVMASANVSLAVDIAVVPGMASTASAGSPYSIVQNGVFQTVKNVVTNKVQSGVDGNGATADATVNVSSAYMDALNIWAANPSDVRAAHVQNVMLHEITHTLGMSGFLNRTTGALESNYRSIYDSQVVVQGGKAYFAGKYATAVLGEKIPLTALGTGSAIYHVDSALDLMGPSSMVGAKASDIDLAMLKDMGYAITKTLVSLDGHTFIPGTAATQETGTGGYDTALYSGKRSDYTVAKVGTGVQITSKTVMGDQDRLIGFESLKFSDYTVDLSVATNALTVIPAQLNSLIELYIALFNRVPDASGLSFWVDTIKAGQSFDQIADTFYNIGVANPTSTGYSTATNNADFVKIVYANVLGRSGTTAPGPSEVGFWAGLLETANMTKGGVVREMLNSAHTYKGHATWGWVADLLDNKIEAGRYFAVEQGLNFDSANTDVIVIQAKAIAQAVTSTGYEAAVSLVGVPDVAWA